MKIDGLTALSVKREEITLDERELIRRLGGCSPERISIIEKCRARFDKAVDYKYCAVFTGVEYFGDELDIGFGRLKSSSLMRNLNGVSQVCIFAATLGIGVDRLLAKLSVMSPSEQFVTDAVASCAIESLCNYAERNLCGQLEHRPRFSPGYGDLPLTVQPQILKILNANKLIGITLTDAILMLPSKSVTAIIGVENENH